MKTCKFCGSNNDSRVLECVNCGATEFENKCDNCGTVFSGNVCPKCGVEVGQPPHICYNCGKKTYQKICPDCGADLLHPIQNVQDTQEDIIVNINNNGAPLQYEIPPQYRQNSKRPGCLETILIFIIIVAFFAVVVTIGLHNENKRDNTGKESLSDIAIVTLAGHPKIYGDYNDAKNIWKNYKNVEVMNGWEYLGKEEKMLTIAGDDKDNYDINNVIINFSNSEDIKHELTIEDILRILSEYVPYDILDKYYIFKDSSRTIDPQNGKYEAYHYYMTLNDEGRAQNEKENADYKDSFAFEIIHRDDDDWIAQIYVSTNQIYDKSYSNTFVSEKWEINLNDYRYIGDNQKNLSDLDILTLENHPKFYGSFDKAKQVWGKYDKVKAVNESEAIFNLHKLLLLTTGKKDNNAITYVNIQFPNTKSIRHKLMLEEVLNVVCEYIPYDIIEKYYMFGGSFMETYKNDKDYVAYYYVMALNNEGKLVNESGKGSYKDIFAFKIVYKNGAWQALIAPLAEKTNYNPNSEYTIKQWDIDINQYSNKK